MAFDKNKWLTALHGQYPCLPRIFLVYSCCELVKTSCWYTTSSATYNFRKHKTTVFNGKQFSRNSVTHFQWNFFIDDGLRLSNFLSSRGYRHHFRPKKYDSSTTNGTFTATTRTQSRFDPTTTTSDDKKLD